MHFGDISPNPLAVEFKALLGTETTGESQQLLLPSVFGGCGVINIWTDADVQIEAADSLETISLSLLA